MKQIGKREKKEEREHGKRIIFLYKKNYKYKKFLI